jgi:biopolymer transport protein ExbD
MAFSSAGGGPFSTGPKMNVTPLIDVLLGLIIVFLLVVVEQQPVGLQTEIPQPNPHSLSIPPPLRTIVIQIRHPKAGGGNTSANLARLEHPQVMVNDEVVEWDHLRERLRDIFAIRVERIAYVEADDDIDFQDVADVIAIAKIAGVDRVGLLTEDGKHVPIGG